MRDLLAQLVDVVDDATTRAAHGERRADDQRESHLRSESLGVGDLVGVGAARHLQADPPHRLGEQPAILALTDDLKGGTDHLHAPPLQRA